MAQKPGISHRIYVLDTSYLTELFEVRRFSEPHAVRKVRNRVKAALASGCMLVVPAPCLFQLADHINDERNNDALRHKLCQELLESVESSLDKSKPWTITPAAGTDLLDQLRSSLKVFVRDYNDHNVNLTHSFAIEEARRLKKKYFGYQVHVWTRNRELKKLEPDSEENPFVR